MNMTFSQTELRDLREKLIKKTKGSKNEAMLVYLIGRLLAAEKIVKSWKSNGRVPSPLLNNWLKLA